MSVSNWLLSTLCVLGLIIAIQVGFVWRILSEFIGIANRIRDIGLEVFGIKSRIDTLIAHAQALISDSTRKNHQETNMDHLKALNSDHEMAVLMESRPWCPMQPDGDDNAICRHLCDEGGWRTWCPDCCAKWLNEPYREDKKR